MPPFIPSKRRISSHSPQAAMPKPAKKPSLFDTADRPNASATLQDNQAFLDRLVGSESDSPLSDISTSDFADAQSNPKKPKLVHHQERDEDDVEWEDAINPVAIPATCPAAGQSSDFLELTLEKSANIPGSITNPHDKRKGPSKIERQIRISTHMMHVQFLLFHNLIRNGWTCDKEVQRILVGQLPLSVNREITKWKAAAGLIPDAVVGHAKPWAYKANKGKRADQDGRNERDWGRPAQRQERGAPNMSRGDPTVRLLKVMAAYWKKRFAVTAPSLRKQGYMPLAVLEEDIASYRNEKPDPEKHGERIENIIGFRNLAQSCSGSRDVGAQLFTALIRGLGLEARLITSLQPIGFGWSKNEVSDHSEEPGFSSTPAAKIGSKKPRSIIGRKDKVRGGRHAPIDLSEESVADSGEYFLTDDDDGASVVEITPSTPRTQTDMGYDRDMPFPTYWTEIVSPCTNEIIPVDPLILTPAVATNSEHLAQFESRGAKADKARQVFGYIVAYSTDGTAKDVTTRYLRRHMWPGRTKGVRIPVEKVPVYNRRGKIKHHEDYDWFKTVMSGYSRTTEMRTAADDIEETKDLKAVKLEKKESKANEGTLQSFKNSAEYVLERHLRREEALGPGARPIKTFITGKGDKVKEEPVYRRIDVEICRTGESWHKEGRAVKPGEQPIKTVPVRAVTLNRKREVEEAERDGEKLKQGLYAMRQTDWIIPPPIENGIIPKNAFGNIDCYVPTMVPKGAVHIPLKSTVRICKRLDIDFAEAVTGFEFGNQRAVPIIEGVVVAKQHEHAVIQEWEKDEQERRIKEEGKREKIALSTWKIWLSGLRVLQRVRKDYGGDTDAQIAEEANPFTNVKKKALQADTGTGSISEGGPFSYSNEEDIGGGFLANDDDLGDFSPEGSDAVEVRHIAAGGVAIEGEKGPVDSNPSSGSPSSDSVRKYGGLLENDECQGLLIQPDRKGNAMVFSKASTNVSKAARQSETALKNQSFEQEDDGFNNSDGEVLKSKDTTMEKSAKRKKNKKGPEPSARAGKSRS